MYLRLTHVDAGRRSDTSLHQFCTGSCGADGEPLSRDGFQREYSWKITIDGERPCTGHSIEPHRQEQRILFRTALS